MSHAGRGGSVAGDGSGTSYGIAPAGHRLRPGNLDRNMIRT